MVTDLNLKVQLSIFDSLIGPHIGQVRPLDKIFTVNNYVKRKQIEKSILLGSVRRHRKIAYMENLPKHQR